MIYFLAHSMIIDLLFKLAVCTQNILEPCTFILIFNSLRHPLRSNYRICFCLLASLHVKKLFSKLISTNGRASYLRTPDNIILKISNLYSFNARKNGQFVLNNISLVHEFLNKIAIVSLY